METKVLFRADAQEQDLGGGAFRSVLAYNEGMMMVHLRCAQGWSSAPHTHPHVQSTYVLAGRFRFTIGGREVEVAQGDSIAFEPEIPHGTVCLEAGELLDVFAPMRKDFI